MSATHTDSADQTINCRDCKSAFTFSAGEQAFYAERGFTPPVRCKPCRDVRKAQRGDGGGNFAPTGGGGQAPRQSSTTYVDTPNDGGGGRKNDGGGRKGGKRRRDNWED